MRRAALTLLSILCATPLAAQDLARPPLKPDSTLAPGPTGAGFAAWRAAIAARGRTGVSFLIDGDRYQILVLTPMAIDALAQDSLIVKATRGCQRALTLSDEQVDHTARIDPWVAFDSAAYARPAVALAIYPKEQRRYDCHAGVLARFAALSRGALYGAFGPPDEHEQVASVELRRDGLVEPALLSGRAKVAKVAHGGFLEDGTEHIRIYVDPQEFAPDAEGRVPQLEIHVFNPLDPEPDVMRLPERLIRAVWQQMLPWQARGLDVAEAPLTPAPLHFDAPKDSALLVAHRAYERGAMGAAASEAMTRLMFIPRPEQTEIRDAMLMSATAFTLRDREAEALSLMADIMEVYPCLTLAPEAPAMLREMVVELRKPARCTSIPLPVIALRSIVPGYGQATSPGRKRFALALFGATAGSYLLADQLHAFSRREYAKYLGYRGNTSVPPEAIYGRVDRARNLGNAATIAAVGVWSFAAVEAVYAEWKHKRALVEVDELGAPRRAHRRADRRERAGTADAGTADAAGTRFAPHLSANAVGLTVRF